MNPELSPLLGAIPQGEQEDAGVLRRDPMNWLELLVPVFHTLLKQHRFQ